ncbi:hypothetical protein SAMN05421642_107275 [Rhodococcoides kyotonense]|uniref:RNA polymerase sigma-70 region 4 domain-containing protein n=2 Tax=Rhodococcoides kyotonense TaxID=398843 RepID=A0A239IXY3_9NOCA|nr:hypothetical protein SAMN05421642_107275 [Rhodococcus kyotonensis]
MLGVNSLPATDLRATPWVELMPWLDDYVSERAALLEALAPGEAWWLEDGPLSTAQDVDLEKVLAELAQLFVSGHKALTFAEGFPAVEAGLPISILGLQTRASTTVRRLTEDKTVEGLLTSTAQDLFVIPGTSEQTVRDVAYALLEISILNDPRVRGPVEDEGSDHSPVLTQLIDDLAALASWRRLRGQHDRPLLAVDIEDESPELIQELAARISAISSRDLPDVEQGDPVDEIENILGQLESRELLALRLRLLALEPISLGELSTRLHLSKPAASAIESQAKAKINAACGYGTAVGNLLASLRIEIQPVASMERLIAVHPTIGRTVPTLDVPLWLVLDGIDDYFEVTKGWAAAPDVDGAKKRTRSLLEDLESPNGVVAFEELAGLTEMPSDELHSWLSWCEIPVIEGSVLTRTKKLADTLVGTLEAIGEPQSPTQLAERGRTGKPVASVHRALEADERAFLGADGLWRLIGWETAVPTPIEPDVEQFEAVEGIVRRRAGRVTKRPEQTRRLYRIGLAWRYRIVVTADQLRGSGFALPAGVAAAVGCERGQTVELKSRLGTQMVRWTGAQPTSGTIGRFLRELDAHVGDEVLLEFSPDRSFAVVRPETLTAEADPLRRALAAIGHPQPSGIAERHLVRVLADAIGLYGETRPRRLLSAYESSSEEHVVALLEEAWMHTGSVDE